MKTYARIETGIVFELLETDENIALMFNPAFVWVDVTNVSPQPQQNWIATETAGNWSFAAPTD